MKKSLRISQLDTQSISDEQRQMQDRLLSGPRASIVGPFKVWLHQPELANVADLFGQYCRFNASIDRKIAELAIMQIARHTGASFEWDHHYPFALQAGVTNAQLEELKKGDPVSGLDERSHMAHSVVREMLATHSLSDDSYRAAIKVLGESTLVVLVAVVGYYSFVSLTINVFNVLD